MEYAFKPFCSIKGDPNAIVARIQQVSKRVGRIDPEALLRDARLPSSPLHDSIEWNDRKAAHLYRLEQVRYIVRSLVHDKDDEGNKMPPVRVFQCLENEEARWKPGEYVQTLTAMSNAEQRAKILQQAIQDIEELKEKYKDLSELASFFQATEREMPKVRKAVASAVSKHKRKEKAPMKFKRPKEKHGYPYVRR